MNFVRIFYFCIFRLPENQTWQFVVCGFYKNNFSIY